MVGKRGEICGRGDGSRGKTASEGRLDQISDIPPLDFLAQRFDRVVEVAQMWVDRQSRLVGFQRVLVIADVLQDQSKPGEGAEMARLARQHFAEIGERANGSTKVAPMP